MTNILLEPYEVWDYYLKHHDELITKPYVIATNDEYGVEITLTAEDNYPLFIVTADDYQQAEESALSENDCESVVKELYEQYLTEQFLTLYDESPDLIVEQEDAISERELELDDMIMAMLSIVLDQEPYLCIAPEEADEMLEDIKDHFLEYLARKHGLPVFRPMILEDTENGDEFYTEYPYKCMEFDDEDNPIYK